MLHSETVWTLLRDEGSKNVRTEALTVRGVALYRTAACFSGSRFLQDVTGNAGLLRGRLSDPTKVHSQTQEVEVSRRRKCQSRAGFDSGGCNRPSF
jgi:hypothetical protein